MAADLAPIPPPHNPYAAPRASVALRSDARARAPGEVIKWLYAGVVGLSFTLCMALRFQRELGFEQGVLHPLGGIVDGPLVWAKTALAAAWIHSAWQGTSPESRGDVTPGNAVGRLLIPIYSVYWLFVVNARLCDALDATLAGAGDHRRAPRVLAQMAPVIYVVLVGIGYVMLVGEAKRLAFVPLTAASVVWIAFSFQCDVARRAVAELAVARAVPREHGS